MTGDYEQMLPLLISCFFAYIVAEGLKNLPIYETLLERDLQKGGHHTSHAQPLVMDFTVQRGSSFDGQRISSLGLPTGCILVRCFDGKREWVPHANTRLAAHMKISAVIAPQATDGVAILKRGCEAHKDIRKPVKNQGKPKRTK
jgi:CIC family chloride channel protein